MPPFSTPFETTLVHIPILFFTLGFLFKIASLFTVRHFMEELAICLLMLATSGIISGFLSQSDFEMPSNIFVSDSISKPEMVQLMVLLSVVTSVICFLTHAFGFSHFGLKIFGFVWYALLLWSVFIVAASDQESIAKYGIELASAIPKIKQLQ